MRLRLARVVRILTWSAPLLLAAFQPLSAQSDPPAILRIRARYNAVNRDSARYERLATTSDDLNLDRRSTDGTQIVAFFDTSDARTLAKLLVTDFGESGSASTEYYFDGGRPVFAFVRQVTYSGTYGPVRSRSETRWYYETRGGQAMLIRAIDSTGRLRDVRDSAVARTASWLAVDAEALAGAVARAAGARAGRRSDPVRTMRQDLRNLATAEETYFAQHQTYTLAPPSLGPNGTVASGSSVRVMMAARDGWAATVARPDAKVACIIAFGTAAQQLRLEEGALTCR